MIKLGNRESIGFEIHDIEKDMISVDLWFDNTLTNKYDNTYYRYLLINNLSLEIKKLKSNTFGLSKDIIQQYSYKNIIDYMWENGLSTNEFGILFDDHKVLDYDVSVTRMFCYIIESEGNNFTICGRLFFDETEEYIRGYKVIIDKNYFISMLEELLKLIS